MKIRCLIVTLAFTLQSANALACIPVSDVSITRGGEKIAGLESLTVDKDEVSFQAGTGNNAVKYRIYSKSYKSPIKKRERDATCVEAVGVCGKDSKNHFCFIHSGPIKSKAALKKILSGSSACANFKDLFQVERGGLHIIATDAGRSRKNIAKVRLDYMLKDGQDLGSPDSYASQLVEHYESCMSLTRERKADVCHAKSRQELAKDYEEIQKTKNEKALFNLTFSPAAGAEDVSKDQRTLVQMKSSFFHVRDPKEYPYSQDVIPTAPPADTDNIPNVHTDPNAKPMEIVHTASVLPLLKDEHKIQDKKAERKPRFIQFRETNMEDPDAVPRGGFALGGPGNGVGIDIDKPGTPLVANGCSAIGGDSKDPVSVDSDGESKTLDAR